ncbi:cobalamin B12-binding domain-containing protein [Nocardioides psychrotolerans]|uniref:Methanogenic corrinoid protein MtbC1 n=1 Tax=Nocardioides psychrotolerans TaxID=1005945 RepID=A0A1I3EQZ6_9ACTN|nr:cobalamin B12-binding domain-containing protein [Nocardioides psychrotolerans]SFI01389.1 Methanogenic corrinoid protein MtbC1 [Nocardioides psychrotolerans]
MSAETAAELGRLRDAVAHEVTKDCLSRHPDWIEHYGEPALAHGVADPRQHIDFLQAAVDLDDPSTFADYALWCRDLLGSRGIAVEFLVKNLEAIRNELAGRLSPPAAEAVAIALRVGLEALTAPRDLTSADGVWLSPACRLYLAAAVSGRRTDALAVVRAALSGGASPPDVYVDILQSALYEVGRRWQTTELTIAEEHMATATTQFILSVIHEDLTHSGSHRRVAVVTGVVDELHVVGASIIANALEADGWDVRFMGTNTPHDAIVSALEHHRATLVAISVTMSGCVAGARDLITQIRGSCAATPRIIVGGAAFRHDPQLWRTIGADGFAADVRSVVELARA